MGIYSRAGEVLQRNWQRFLKSLRIQFGRIRVYSSRLGVTGRIMRLSLERSYPLRECRMLPAATVLEPAMATTEVEDGLESMQATVRSPETGNGAEVVVQPLDMLPLEPEMVSVQAELDTATLALAFSGVFETAVVDGGVAFNAKQLPVRRIPPPGVAAALKSGIDAVLKVPVIRTAVPLKQLSTTRRIEYWNQVKASINRPPASLKLVGVFNNVPRGGIQQAKIDTRNGILRLWLKSGKPGTIRSGTLLIARDVEESKIYQIFANE